MTNAGDPGRAGTGVLAGRVVVVFGGEHGIGLDIAQGLADQGAAVAALGGGAVFDRGECETALARVADELGRVDAIVFAAVPFDAAAVTPLAETDEEHWRARCEALLHAAVACSQAAHSVFSSSGGRLLFVTPSFSQGGIPGLVPLSTAMEGIRALAKSVARSWGQLGITVNCVAVPMASFLAPGMAVPDSPTRNPAALGRSPDARTELAPVVAFLTGDAGRFVTGATVPVDGGVIMTP